MDFLSSLDRAVFVFLNQTIANPVGDVLWPLITDYDKLLPVRIILACAWLYLLVKGGRTGRTVALLLLPLLFISDRLSSSILKDLFVRPRPCHEIGGIPVIQGIRLLVDCGPGTSFPSSHAVNNFAVATLFSYYYRASLPYVAGWAGLVALSRPAVGVHYPSDILGGAIIGIAVAAFLLWSWRTIERRFLPASAPKSGPNG